MRKAIFASAAIHAAVIGATLIVWPHALDQSDEPPIVIPIDLVTVADETNIAATTAEEPKVETPPKEQPAPEPPPEQAEAPPDPEPAPLPEDAKPVEKVEATPPPPPTVRLMQKPKPDQPQQKFDPDKILALLDQKAPKPVTPPPNAAKGVKTQVGIGAQTALTMSEVDAFKAQMKECWNAPVGAPSPEQLIVGVHVSFTQDGHLQQPPRLTSETRAEAAGNPYMRAAAEAALRAISVCEPYRMPADRYNSWREMDLLFDPSKMVGR